MPQDRKRKSPPNDGPPRVYLHACDHCGAANPDEKLRRNMAAPCSSCGKTPIRSVWKTLSQVWRMSH